MAALWVHVDPATGRPKRLSPSFFDVYGEAAGGRTVHAPARATTRPPEGRAADAVAAAVQRLRRARPRQQRRVLGHRRRVLRPDRARPRSTVEYRGGIDRGQRVEVVVDDHELWLLADGAVAASGTDRRARGYTL